MEEQGNLNLKAFILSNSIVYFAAGLFGSFYFLFIEKMGGSIENFGISVGLMTIAQASTSYFGGKYSDKFGRKPFLIASGFISALTVFLYTIINSLWQLFALQVLNGIISSIYGTSELSFLGDITEKTTRGLNIGKYNAIVGIFAGLAVILGGFLIGKFGFKLIFYFCSLFYLVGTLLLLRIKE
ncbi:hypothetical protein A3K63_00440 [Candidatus Micrarchaeota archaeon RBG_16_49_10]|nr:MAG: hypothetical protein A3K63_00440 [Candidatus Micrarchaeota archaeon RBG_16_49_10]